MIQKSCIYFHLYEERDVAHKAINNINFLVLLPIGDCNRMATWYTFIEFYTMDLFTVHLFYDFKNVGKILIVY